MILSKSQTLDFLRRRPTPVTVRLPNGKPANFSSNYDVLILVANNLAIGVGNPRKLSYVSLRFVTQIDHATARMIRRARISYSCEDSRTWIRSSPLTYEPHPVHCAAFSPVNKEAFV